MSISDHIIVPKTAGAVGRGSLRTYFMALHPPESTGRYGQLHLKGYWEPQADLAASNLAEAVHTCEASAEFQVLKRDKRVLVGHGQLFGESVVIKRYELAGTVEKLKYLARFSRARRYWAAAKTLVDLNIPTPRPYGFLEECQAGIPVRSYVLTAFVENVLPAHLWIDPEYEQNKTLQKTCSQALSEALLSLYRAGVYHRDTKASNLIVQLPVSPETVNLLWIDLECLRCGKRPRRHDIVRNLVQLNGSMTRYVPEQVCCEFLQEFSRTYPWVTQPKVVEKIKKWTSSRLNKEQRTGCGP